jgi:hypothetical protein
MQPTVAHLDLGLGHNFAVGASHVAPALDGLRFLEGSWEMELSQAAFLPEGAVVRGTAVFEFIDDGRLLAFRQGDAATWIIGRDDSSILYTVLYSDGRGVSRVYAMTLDDGAWKIWRDDEEFSQRFAAVVSADHDLISGRWEKRPGGGDWESDFAVTYRRVG